MSEVKRLTVCSVLIVLMGGIGGVAGKKAHKEEKLDFPSFDSGICLSWGFRLFLFYQGIHSLCV